MKKYLLSLMALALGILSAYAQTISVADATIKAGETKVVSINLDNTQTNIVSFQMDLTLPDGITINKAGCSLGSRITDASQELTIGKQLNGSYRLTSTSFALTPITGTSGELVKLSLTAANDAKGGTASIKNIRLATSDSQKLTPSNASFIVNVPYTLTYKVDGNVYKTLTVNYGTAITPETAPTKEGHTFSGWSQIPATMPNRDVVVNGTFTINSYTLTYKVDGNVYKTSTVVYGSTITPEAAPTKEGHTFSGWSEIPTTMPANDVVVTGTFTVNNYTLTYKVDGTDYKTLTVAYGTTITPEAAPTKEGYTFSGWSEIPATMPANDVVVTGTFTVNKYTLTYKVDGTDYKTLTVAYGTTITPEAAPTKEGYTFSGWSEIPTTMLAKDVVVTGTFTVNNYTLTYKVDGTDYKTLTVAYGTTITPEAAPTKEGYTFSGWSEIPTTMLANDVVVTGSFSINSYTLTYKVDGEVYKTSTVVYRTAITPEAEPIKVGYTFSGWSEIPAAMPANDVVVTGSFSINSYTLTYKVDGEVYKTSTVVYGTAITPEAEPIKEGYTFSGWSEIPATMPANDVTVTGSFSINSYTLTYKVDGEVYKTSTVAYGTAITPEAEPTKEGYTFSGWSEIPATMPANDVVVTGTFTMNPATVTAKSYTIEYGDVIPTFEYESEGPLFGAPALTCSATVGSPVGTYQIQVAKGTVSNNNVTYNAGTLTITPASLSITANSYVINQGEMLPVLEATYEGFKNGETAEVLTKQPILSCDASSDSEEGTYEIIVSGAEAENYTISYTNGTLTITNEETDISQLDNAIYIESFSARIGDNAQVEICLKNAEAATAYVFDLILPEGISVAKNEKDKYLDELSDRHDDHTRTFNYKGENTYALSALSGNSEELSGNDGTIRLLTLYVDESVAEGVYPIKIRNASYSKPDGSLVTMPSTISFVTVEDYLIGDVNGNGGVDIGDAVSIVNYLVGKESSSFVEKAADTNHNGQIDIGDAVTIVNFLVGKTSSLSPQSVKTWDENEPQ